MRNAVNRIALATGLVALGWLASPEAEARAPWGAREIGLSGTAALEAFRKTAGAEAYSKVVGLSVTMRAPKNSARAVVTYETQAGRQTKSFFCHTHGAEIDCH